VSTEPQPATQAPAPQPDARPPPRPPRPVSLAGKPGQ